MAVALQQRKGELLLAKNQQKASDGATLQAGARAILIPSPITNALSTFTGRIAAQAMLVMGVRQSRMNKGMLRP